MKRMKFSNAFTLDECVKEIMKLPPGRRCLDGKMEMLTEEGKTWRRCLWRRAASAIIAKHGGALEDCAHLPVTLSEETLKEMLQEISKVFRASKIEKTSA